jgi:hypothetical protein
VVAGRRKRLKKARPASRLFDRERRLGACQVVRLVADDREFDCTALDAAVEAVLRHPHAGDEQIIAFLRWFSSDANPMP